MRFLLIFLWTISISITVFGQKIKQQTEINYWYYYGSKEPRIDTIIWKYDTTGRIIFAGYDPEVLLYDTIIRIDTTPNHAHWHKVVRGGGKQDFYITYYSDSTITYWVNKNDTNDKEIEYLNHGKTSRTIFWDKVKGGKYVKTTSFIYKDNLFVECTLEFSDTILKHKDKYSKLLRINKHFSYNNSTKKWYVEWKDTRGFFNGRLKRSVQRTYNENINGYGKTSETYYYNKEGKRKLVIRRNDDGFIERKQVYKYDYY